MDIKPENILITEDGVLKLGDLGMTRPVGCNEDGLEGDARYIAPELLNSPIKTRQLDLFSLGVMIWELAARRNPPKEGDLWQKFRDGRGMFKKSKVEKKFKFNLYKLIYISCLYALVIVVMIVYSLILLFYFYIIFFLFFYFLILTFFALFNFFVFYFFIQLRIHLVLVSVVRKNCVIWYGC
jgi:serine/threonine protein kinase